MRRIRVAQIGTSRYSHGNYIFESMIRQPEFFEIVGYSMPEGEKEKFPERTALFRLRSATPQKSGSHKRKAIIAPQQPAENEAQKRPQSLGQVHQDQSHPNDAEGRLLQMCGNAA